MTVGQGAAICIVFRFYSFNLNDRVFVTLSRHFAVRSLRDVQVLCRGVVMSYLACGARYVIVARNVGSAPIESIYSSPEQVMLRHVSIGCDHVIASTPFLIQDVCQLVL